MGEMSSNRWKMATAYQKKIQKITNWLDFVFDFAFIDCNRHQSTPDNSSRFYSGSCKKKSKTSRKRKSKTWLEWLESPNHGSDLPAGITADNKTAECRGKKTNTRQREVGEEVPPPPAEGGNAELTVIQRLCTYG